MRSPRWNAGPVGFIAQSLNVHRRHSQSVTHARKAEAHYDEIARMQEFVAGRVDLDKATLERQKAYRAEVKVYLGLHIKQDVVGAAADRAAVSKAAGSRPARGARSIRWP